MMVPILLLAVGEEVCNLGSSQYPWVVKNGTVEQIVVRGRRSLMKPENLELYFEGDPRLVTLTVL